MKIIVGVKGGRGIPMKRWIYKLEIDLNIAGEGIKKYLGET